MAKLTLQITGNISDVESKIKIIQNELSAIEKKPIKIGVQASGLDAIADKLKEISAENVKAAEAAAKLANAEARKLNAQAKAAAETRKAADAAKAHTQVAQADAEATQKAAISNEKLTESMKLSAKQADYAKQRGQELYNQYLQLAQAVNEAAHGALTFYQSTSLVIRNVGLAEAQVRSLASAYRELGVAVSGINGGNGGSGAAGYFQPNTGVPQTGISTTGSREVVWSRYGDFRDNAFEGQWRPVVEGTEAVAQSATRANSAFNTLRVGLGAAWQKMGEGTPVADALGDSIGNIIVKITTWQVVNGIVANIKRAFSDALETMKAVDQELINIQKVSDLTNEDIQRIGEGAYDVASKYGVAADEYLKAVYKFQKAGLGDSAEKLAELATKTMLVGDTTADVAAQFLISANAAWKFGGSVEALSQIVDEADKLNNTYAVSLQDIAEGLPIVGATAAQVGLTAEQTMAAISTIVASTGQSATKAATALRAIIMNLIGETGELDDGTKVTEESIKSLNTVLNQYARESLAAAEAEGKILDPMEAIAALAKAAEDGFLNQAELFEVLSGLGGKLRTTQLTALVNNMEMYNSMLHDTADAAGTADNEISKMLESWNSRTQILTNNFTKLISHLVDSEGIKAGIDILNSIVVAADKGAGKFALLTVSILGVVKAFTMLATTSIGSTLVALTSGFITLGEAVSVLSSALLASPLFWAVGVAAVIYGVVKALDALNVSYEEAAESATKLNAEFEKQFGAGSEYDRLKSKVDELTVSEHKRLIELEGQKKALEDQVKSAEKLAARKWLEENSRNVISAGYIINGAAPIPGAPDGTTKSSTKNLEELTKAVDAASDAYFDLQYGIEGYTDALSNAIGPFKSYYDGLASARDAGEALTEEETAFITLYENAIGIIGRNTVSTQENTDAKSSNTSATKENADANETLQKAFDEVEKKSSLTYGTLAELEALYPGLSARILDANGNLTAEGKAALSTKAAFIDLLAQMTVFNNTGLDVSGKIAQLQALATMAGVTASSIAMAVGAGDISKSADAYIIEWGMSRDEAEQRALEDYYNYNWRNAVNDALKNKEYIGGGGGGGGGGGSTEDLTLAQLKQIIADEKARYELMVKQGASAEELAAQAQIIQDALHDQAERMRELGASYSDVAALSKEWFDWEDKKNKTLQEGYADTVSALKNQLDFLEASGASEEEQVAKMREIQDALHNQAEYLRSIKADEEEIRKLSTEWWNIQNKILDVTEKIAKKLRDEIADTLGNIADTVDAAQKAAVKPLQDELDALEEAHNATKERADEEEKIAAIQERQLELEKARIALENAQRERTVRQYNARTGQWEWVANAKNVEAAQQNLENAQKNLIDAQTDLANYYAEQEYKQQKENLDKQITATNNAFSAFRDAINEAAQAIRDGRMSYEEAYAYIKAAMHQIYDEYGIDLSSVMDDVTAKLEEEFNKPLEKFSDMEDAIQKAIDEIKAKSSDPARAIDEFARAVYLALETDNPEAAIAALVQRIMDGADSFNDVDTLLEQINGDYDETTKQTARLLLIAKMQANSAEWHVADENRQRELHDQNVDIGNALGWNYQKESGLWYDEYGNVAYTPGGSGASALGTYGDDFFTKLAQTLYDAISNITINVNVNGGNGSGSASSSSDGSDLVAQRAAQAAAQNSQTTSGTSTRDSSAYDDYTAAHNRKKTFDSGGVLHGLGGIKATREDEMVLPPAATKALINAEADGTFDSLVKHLGIVTAAAYRIAGYGGGRPANAIGSQHNGDVYEIDGVTLTEQQARGMTVYDLAQMGRSLALHRGS